MSNKYKYNKILFQFQISNLLTLTNPQQTITNKKCKKVYASRIP